MMAGFETALPLQIEAIELARSAGSPLVLAACLNNLAVFALGVGETIDLARPAIREAYTLVEHRSGPMAATVLSTYGDVARWDGDLPRAAELYTRSLRDGWLGRLSGIIMSNLMGLAMLEVASGANGRPRHDSSALWTPSSAWATTTSSLTPATFRANSRACRAGRRRARRGNVSDGLGGRHEGATGGDRRGAACGGGRGHRMIHGPADAAHA